MHGRSKKKAWTATSIADTKINSVAFDFVEASWLWDTVGENVGTTNLTLINDNQTCLANFDGSTYKPRNRHLEKGFIGFVSKSGTNLPRWDMNSRTQCQSTGFLRPWMVLNTCVSTSWLAWRIQKDQIWEDHNLGKSEFGMVRNQEYWDQ